MKKLLAVSLVLNALVILAVGWFGFGPGRLTLMRSFLEGHQARLVSAFEAFPLAPDDVVFLGDSITENGPWEELFPGVRTRNRGIGGDTTAGVLRRLEQITRARPTKIFLLIGTNDLGRGATASEVVSGIEEIIDRLKQESPDSEVYVQSVLPRAADYRERIEALNARLAEVTGEMGVAWVDLYPSFVDPETGAIRPELSNDALHLLGHGYALWKEQIEPLVRAGTEPVVEIPAEELAPEAPPAEAGAEGF